MAKAKAKKQAGAKQNAAAAGEASESVIAALKAECAAANEKMLRALAEAENTRRRAERDLAQAQKYAHAGFVRDLIGVVENLTRAVAAIPPNQSGLDDSTKNLVVGIQMVAGEMDKVLAQHGITRLDPTGAVFDPTHHQAVGEAETRDAKAGTIVTTAQSGWMLHDRLLQPAMVVVAKAAAAAGDKGKK